MIDFSKITDDLYIGTTPEPADYDRLRKLGITLVINMRVERRPTQDPHNPAIPRLWLPTFDTPLIPIPLRALERGVEAALKTIAKGGKVYAHCAAGVHRSVALAAAILIAQGFDLEAAIRLIKDRRASADPDAWYIRRRIKKFAESWQH